MLGPDFVVGVLPEAGEALLELELGVEVEVEPELPGVAEAPEVSSLVVTLDFRLDFLLETLLR